MTLRLDLVWRSSDCNVLQEIINESLGQLLEWSMGNSLLINSANSKTMLFGNANRSGSHLRILLGVSYIEIIDLHTCLEPSVIRSGKFKRELQRSLALYRKILVQLQDQGMRTKQTEQVVSAVYRPRCCIAGLFFVYGWWLNQCVDHAALVHIATDKLLNTI
uniref:Uncharacterized protein n=1 Tax=Glossina pallidipes TaxID=7398 RepID=A0A1A9Z8K5_GLOPL